MSNSNLTKLVAQAKVLIQQIVQHPDFQAVDYHPDLTITDALSALNYLHWELENNQQPSMETEKQSI
jgi:hypothetical protein